MKCRLSLLLSAGILLPLSQGLLYADTLVSVSSSSGIGMSIAPPLAVSWTQADTYQNVQISVFFAGNLVPGNVGGPVTAYLVNDIGPGVSAKTVINSTSLSSTPFGLQPVFSNLRLGPGTYYLVIGATAPNSVGWGVVTVAPPDMNGNVTVVPDINGVTSYSSGTGTDYTAPFRPFVEKQFQLAFQVTGSPVTFSPCKNTTIDTSQSFGLATVTLSSTGACSGILTIANNRNYWTNLQVSTVGFATATAIGGSLNPYAAVGVLPPSGFFGSGTAVQYNVSFSNSGDLITVFVDPSNENGQFAAQQLNLTQILLNAVPIPGNSVPQILIPDYVAVIQALGQMPDLSNAGSALFSNPPNITAFLQDLGLFIENPSEQAVFSSLEENLVISDGTALVQEGLFSYLESATSWPVRILLAGVYSLGDIVDFGFRYTAGSVFVNAQ
jgi:hypothetical protein